MGYMIFMVLLSALMAGFILLTRREAYSGVRIFEAQRASFDKRVSRVQFILTHIDFEAFMREQVRVLAAHIAHDIAHFSLVFVRAVERLLTRHVRNLRNRHGIETATAVAPRAFVRTMRDFKQQLAAARPPIPEI